MVLILNQQTRNLGQCDLFPSPCGDYGSYLIEDERYENYDFEVSVPLRGLWFLSSTPS